MLSVILKPSSDNEKLSACISRGYDSRPLWLPNNAQYNVLTRELSINIL